MNMENEIKQINLEDIIPNRFQPRLTFDERALNELADSIKEHGIIQPLVLRKLGDKYEIIAGERRYKASFIAGLTSVPAIIMNVDDNNSAELAIVENLQRRDLTAIEEAQSYKKLLDKGYLTQEELAKKMGVAQSTVANKLRLLNLAKEVQTALLENKISERHARSLLQLPQEKQVELLNQIIEKRLTVKQTEDEINKLLGKEVQSSATENIFDMNINEVKANAEDIIEQPKPVDFSSLLKTEEEVKQSSPQLDLEETETNINMGPIIDNQSISAINPFQEPEILNFNTTEKEVVPESFENFGEALREETPKSSILDEFRIQKGIESEVSSPETQTSVQNGSLATAINSTRNLVQNIESSGIQVDTEEFDFEDMYQIIIKIQK